ncbi:MAG: threonylcarbamoyl-AMP synthase, partial [Magnetococcales bacterium]|nr:threonylcarbamoyl-AMP synthase [Magnetococcales bacterium]
MAESPSCPDGLPSIAELANACKVLHDGGIVAHPTETVYGLGVDPFQPLALQRLLAVKGRDATKGLILLIQNMADLARVADTPSSHAQRLMRHFWPGPLTLLLPARKGLPDIVTGGRPTVAVRYSSSRHVAMLLGVWGQPLVSTSANLAGDPPLRDSQAVAECFGSKIHCIMPGCCQSGVLPTTIIGFEDTGPKIVRQGTLTARMLACALPDIDFDAS